MAFQSLYSLNFSLSIEAYPILLHSYLLPHFHIELIIITGKNIKADTIDPDKIPNHNRVNTLLMNFPVASHQKNPHRKAKKNIINICISFHYAAVTVLFSFESIKLFKSFTIYV